VKEPTCVEIANDFELWEEYIDPHATMTRQEFEDGSAEERLTVIHDLCPMDCNCGWIEEQCEEETK